MVAPRYAFIISTPFQNKTTMKRIVLFIWMVSLLFISCTQQKGKRISLQDEGKDWYALFNSKDLSGWKYSDKEGTFSVKDSMIVVNGFRSHLYYVGSILNHDFRNFEFKAEVMTKPGSNSGIYFHTD